MNIQWSKSVYPMDQKDQVLLCNSQNLSKHAVYRQMASVFRVNS